MAHGVEGRFPFLDHRVFAYSARLPAQRKLQGMREKVALREIAAKVLPPAIAERGKQPYRAPEIAPFFAPDAPEWVEEALSDVGAARDGDMGRAPRRRPSAEVPRRSRDRNARVDGARGYPLDPALASGVHGQGESRATRLRSGSRT